MPATSRASDLLAGESEFAPLAGTFFQDASPTAARKPGADRGRPESAMIYAVNYDLKQPGRDYAGLYGAIKSCGPWWHYLGSTWLVDTALDAAGVAARLRPHIDTNDRLLVIRVVADSDGWLPRDAWEWINQRLRFEA